jgi:ABC-type multidrug transport system ATPase subunit
MGLVSFRQRSYRWFDRFSVMLTRNLRLVYRDTFALVLVLLVPFLFTFFVFIAHLSYNDDAIFSRTTGPKPDPPAIPLSSYVEPCRAVVSDRCYNFAVVPGSNSTVVGWVQEVSRRLGLSTAVNESGGIITFETSDALNEFMVANPNVTQAAYVFEPEQLRAIDAGRISFTVQYNQSCQQTFPGFICRYQEVYLVPGMIAAMNDVLLGTRLNLSSAFMPHPKLQSALDAFEEFGPFMMFGSLVIVFVYYLMVLVGEKELKLREALKMIGLSQSLYFLSEGVVFILVSTLSVFLLYAFGALFQFQFYLKNAFGCVFFTYWIFSLSLICWAFFFHVFLTRSNQVSSAAFVFFILSYLLGSSGAYLYYDKPSGGPFVSRSLLFLRYVFALLSPVMFYKCVTDLSIYSAVFTGLRWSDRASYTNLWPLTQCWSWMIWTGIVVLVLAIYLDNVLPNVYGVSLPWWYPFSAAYWRGDALHLQQQKRKAWRLFRRHRRQRSQIDTTGDADDAEADEAVSAAIAALTAQQRHVDAEDALNGKEGYEPKDAAAAAALTKSWAASALEHNGDMPAIDASDHEGIIVAPETDAKAASAPLILASSSSSPMSSSTELESAREPDTTASFLERLQSMVGVARDPSHRHSDDTPEAKTADAAVDADVAAEREAVLSGRGLSPASALVIRRLTKHFRKQLAVDDLCLSADHGALTCLLGPNGSGKTTTFNMLTGVFRPTAGDAWVYGYSITQEQQLLRPLMGVCPQHDIQWANLTAAEHVYLFATLKGIPRSKRHDEVSRRLEQVDLLRVSHKYPRQMSGGMRRRLSVAMALVGDPLIVYLDEPTTGMDPSMRRAVWNMIAAAKPGRTIVHTTHSMEEADVLGDRIAIMYRGRLSVLGTPLRLKHKFGTGYRLSVTVQATQSEALHDRLRALYPRVKRLSISTLADQRYVLCEYELVPLESTNLFRTSDDGGTNQYRSVQAQRRLFQEMENNASGWGIADFSVSGTSLESVFIRVFELNEQLQHTAEASARAAAAEPKRRTWPWLRWPWVKSRRGELQSQPMQTAETETRR